MRPVTPKIANFALKFKSLKIQFKMKLKFLSAAIASAVLTLSSCSSLGSAGNLGNVLGSVLGTTGSTTGTTSTASNTMGILGNILSSVLGSGSLSESDVYGTWSYTGSDCVFETENLLMKAGGAVAANKLESEINTQLQKIGIKPGACSFTFNQDKSFSANIGGKQISGTYTLDTANKKIQLSTLFGLGKLTANVAKSGNKLSLLFDSDKALKLISIAGSLTGNSAVKTITGLAEKYDGMMIGLQMAK